MQALGPSLVDLELLPRHHAGRHDHLEQLPGGRLDLDHAGHVTFIVVDAGAATAIWVPGAATWAAATWVAGSATHPRAAGAEACTPWEPENLLSTLSGVPLESRAKPD